MNFGELKSAVEDVLGRSDIPTIAYTLMMDSAVKELRPLDLEATATLTAPYTLPTDFADAVWVKDGDCALQVTETFPDYASSGSPVMYRMTATGLETWPAYEGDLTLRYHANPAALVNPADTNAILNRYPAVALYGALLQYAKLVRDADAGQAYTPAYGEAITAAKLDEGRRRYSGGRFAINAEPIP
jgi:hypothetical protein